MNTTIYNTLIHHSQTPKEKYLKWYCKLIEKRTINVLHKKQGLYLESHHIIPKSFVDNDVIINLTAREHYIAHLLLSKGTNNPKMIKALHRMVFSSSSTHQRIFNVSSRVYEYLKTEHAKVVSNYSTNTCTCFCIIEKRFKRVPIDVFYKYKNVTLFAPNHNKTCTDYTINQRISTSYPLEIIVNGIRVNESEIVKYSQLARRLLFGQFNIKRITNTVLKKYQSLLHMSILPTIRVSELEELVRSNIIVEIKTGWSYEEAKKQLTKKRRATSLNTSRAVKSRECRTQYIFNTPTGVLKSTHDLIQAYPWITQDVIKSIVANKIIRHHKYNTIMKEHMGRTWNEIGFFFYKKKP